jgi:hypothetical protein
VNTATTPWTFYYWNNNAWNLIGMPANTAPTSVSIVGTNLVVAANGSTSTLPISSLCSALSSVGCNLGGSGGGATTNSLTVTSNDVVSTVNGVTSTFSLASLCSALAAGGCSSLGGGGGGLSGSWQDVTTGKTGFSTYTNTYGKVIAVYIRSIGGNSITATVGGLTFPTYIDTSFGTASVNLLVPAGATYSFNDGNAFVAAWYELR